MQVLRPDQCEPAGRGDGRDHRRLRRRPPRPPAPPLASWPARPPSAGLATPWSPSTATRPRWSRPESAPPLLTDLDQKLELLADCGIDLALVVPFDRARADESAEDFVAEVLVGALGARLVVVGEDFHFGHGRKGNVALLQRAGGGRRLRRRGRRPGRPTATRPSPRPASGPLVADGRRGRGGGARSGRPHQVRGPVVHGDGRGGPSSGFPTANVAVPAGIALPGVGIYAGWYTRPDGTGPPGGHLGGAAPHLLRRRRRARPPWSRPTCSTSTPTSTARRAGSPSSNGCGARCASSGCRTWWPRCTATWPRPGPCSAGTGRTRGLSGDRSGQAPPTCYHLRARGTSPSPGRRPWPRPVCGAPAGRRPRALPESHRPPTVKVSP